MNGKLNSLVPYNLALSERRVKHETLISSGDLSNRFQKLLPELSGARSVARRQNLRGECRVWRLSV
jgi:hypothetical protein